jgi:hypothetical protein
MSPVLDIIVCHGCYLEAVRISLHAHEIDLRDAADRHAKGREAGAMR